MIAVPSIAFDMTFPSRNSAGSGVYANELLAQLKLSGELAVTTVAARAGGGSPRTLGWLIGGARLAVARADLVHCPAFVAPWRLGVPLVLTVHDTSTEKFPEDHTLEWRTYTRLFLPERARVAARVVTGTDYTRREIIRDLGVDPERIVVTPYGVGEQFGRHLRPYTRRGDHPLLLFPGAPTRRKNLELVLIAMAAAPETSALSRARLAISGARADQFPHHRTRIESLRLASRVDWLGKLQAAAMPELMASADLVVYPSLYEGFGFPALEAMLAGTPVVASTAGCLPEVLGDGALLVDPNDVRAFAEAANAALTREDVCKNLIERGRARAALYSWSRCAGLTIEVYRDVLARDSRAKATKLG
jgi:glycosyltransferase involved in cell wall biosynthesis